MSNKVTKLGLIGCGNISHIYIDSAKRFQNIELIAVADLIHDRAIAKAKENDIPKALTVEQILGDPDVEIIINLTIPKVHAEIAYAAIEAGKHVYNEKPFAISREDGKRVLDLAKSKGLRTGCAPDTFFGAGQQTCRKLIDDGVIGEPVAATGFMQSHGPEDWHPDPGFFFANGGGPLFDMGPYYITSLVNLISGVRRVSGSARASFAERSIGSAPRRGEVIKVETPTHISGVLDFDNGAIATLVTSFDVWHHTHSSIEIYGTEGSMLVPDPNGFGGDVKIRSKDNDDWQTVPHTHSFAENSRGVGVADMAMAIEQNRPTRASGELAFHVLDTMQSILESSESGRHITLESQVKRPDALPMGLPENMID